MENSVCVCVCVCVFFWVLSGRGRGLPSQMYEISVLVAKLQITTCLHFGGVGGSCLCFSFYIDYIHKLLRLLQMPLIPHEQNSS